MMDLEKLSGTTNDAVNDDSPAGLRLDLLIDDLDTMAVLASYPEGQERNRFVSTALCIEPVEQIMSVI